MWLELAKDGAPAQRSMDLHLISDFLVVAMMIGWRPHARSARGGPLLPARSVSHHPCNCSAPFRPTNDQVLGAGSTPLIRNWLPAKFCTILSQI
jgi:hypothetical protein